MSLTEQLADAERDLGVTRRTHDDGVEIVADFGSAPNATVDVVDGTAIVVAGEEQYELPVEADAQAFMQNGVLTIEVEG